MKKIEIKLPKGTPEGTSITLNDWSDLLVLFEEFDPKNSTQQYIFRGVKDPSHFLVPGAGRPVLRDGRDLSKVVYRTYEVSEERRLFDEFKKTSRPYINYDPKSELEWMAIAQHHSLMTRLLDWTESPLYALYFAVEGAGEGSHFIKDSIVYAAPVPALVGDYDDPFFFGDDVLLYRPPHISPRITAQRGVFTVHPQPTDAWQPPGLRKYIIPKGKKLLFKRRLMFAGISRSSLYPDIDSLAQTLNWRHKWNWY